MGIHLEANASASYSQALPVSFPNYITLLLPINRQNILQLRLGTGLFSPQPVLVTTKVMLRNLIYLASTGMTRSLKYSELRSLYLSSPHD